MALVYDTANFTPYALHGGLNSSCPDSPASIQKDAIVFIIQAPTMTRFYLGENPHG